MMLRPRRFYPFQNGSSSTAVIVVALFLCLLPFAGALEVHHIFGDLDHDGHEHSDFDLCQWVQAHGSGSLDLDHHETASPLQVDHGRWHPSDVVVSSIDLPIYASRGPPLFL